MKIGILCLQGAVQDHLAPLSRLGAEGVEVRHPADLEGLSGLILPGGESTVMARFIAGYGLAEPIRAFAAAGKPVWGLCAGAIILSTEILSAPGREALPGPLGLLPARAIRNAYGRQASSFEEEVSTMTGPFHGIFIRAPRLEPLGETEILGRRSNGEPVILRAGKILAASFHPELSGDDRLHEYFLSLCK